MAMLRVAKQPEGSMLTHICGNCLLLLNTQRRLHEPAGAAPQVARQMLLYVLLAGRGWPRAQQRIHAHDEARRAEAALRAVRTRQALLHRVQAGARVADACVQARTSVDRTSVEGALGRSVSWARYQSACTSAACATGTFVASPRAPGKARANHLPIICNKLDRPTPGLGAVTSTRTLQVQ